MYTISSLVGPKKFVAMILLTTVLFSATVPGIASANVQNEQSLFQNIAGILEHIQRFLTGQVAGAGGIEVSNSTQLLNALSTAKSGDRILLAPGTYTLSLSVQYGQPFAAYPGEVTITSKDPSNPATFTSFAVNGVHNLTVDNVIFDYVYKAADPTWTSPFHIGGSAKNVTIRNSVFDGDEASGTGDAANDGFGTAKGLQVDGRSTIARASGILIENNRFHRWHRAATFGEVDGLIVRNNEVYDIRSDGFDFAAVQNVVIEGNYLHDFRKSATSLDHMDMIQFWTNGTTWPNVNITIKNNWLLTEAGDWTQSIFMRNEEVDSGRAGTEMYYRNVLIENNVIHNAHAHGISLGEADGVIVRNNTLLHNIDAGNPADPLSSVHVPKISMNANSLNVNVTKNIMPILTSGTDPASFSDNIYVQQSDASQDHYYNDYFVNALAGEAIQKGDLTVVPGSLVDTGNYGSALLKPASDFVYIAGTAGTKFDSQSYAFTLEGNNLKSATWNFGDGGTASGLAVTHKYANAGPVTITANVTRVDNSTVTTKHTINVVSPFALRVDFSDGAKDTSSQNLKGTITGTAAVTDGSLRYLGGAIEHVSYTRPLPLLLNNEEYTMAYDILFPEAVASKWMLYFSGTLNFGMSPTAATFSFSSNLGSHTIKPTVNLALNTWHRVVFVFNGPQNTATVYINGTKVGELTNIGSTQVGSKSHDFILGDAWSNSVAHSLDNVLFLRGALSPAQVTAYTNDGTLPVGAPLPDPDPGPDPDPEPTPAPTASLLVSPSVLTETQSSMLFWNSLNALSCAASGAWSGAKALIGSESTGPLRSGTKTFTLACTGAGGTTSTSTSVTVSAAPPPPPPQTYQFPAGTVVAVTQTLNVRSIPEGKVLGKQSVGTLGTVGIQTPISSGGYMWTYVDFATGADGWVVVDYLVKSTLSVTPLAIGSRVVVTESVKARESYTTSSRQLAVRKSGETGLIIGGPQSGNGYIWWNVDFDSGADGWVIGDSLR